MNTWQVLQQFRYLLEQQEWTSGVPVFGDSSVVVSVQPEPEAAAQRRLPLALIRPLGATSDPDRGGEIEDLLAQDVVVRVVVAVKGDRLGENALIGANREGQLASGGRGLLEIEEKVFDALLSADDDLGLRVHARHASAAGAQPVSDLGYMVWRDYVFRADVTADRFYHPPYGLAASVAGGNVTLTWSLPPARFDRQKVVLRRASGSTPPASASAGTGVTLASDLATSVVNAPGAGTWSYALFAEYDEWEDDTSLRYSAAATVAGVVVT